MRNWFSSSTVEASWRRAGGAACGGPGLGGGEGGEAWSKDGLISSPGLFVPEAGGAPDFSASPVLPESCL